MGKVNSWCGDDDDADDHAGCTVNATIKNSIIKTITHTVYLLRCFFFLTEGNETEPK